MNDKFFSLINAYNITIDSPESIDCLIKLLDKYFADHRFDTKQVITYLEQYVKVEISLTGIFNALSDTIDEIIKINTNDAGICIINQFIVDLNEFKNMLSPNESIDCLQYLYDKIKMLEPCSEIVILNQLVEDLFSSIVSKNFRIISYVLGAIINDEKFDASNQLFKLYTICLLLNKVVARKVCEFNKGIYEI